MMKKAISVIQRDSNVELLRIISMILVLITHACYVSLGPPTYNDIAGSFASSLMRSLSESLSDVGVNTFILISGWFGIRSRMGRFMEFVFQIYFIEIVLYVTMRVLGLTEAMGMDGWLELFFFRYGTYWFIKAYIVLYVFAPILNAFTETCSRKQLRYFLISFYIVQSVYGFYINTGWFSSGYSPLSFIGLYILGRYMHLYPNQFTKFDKFVDLTLYLMVALITALFSLAMTYFFGKVGTALFKNSCPLMIISSVYFFLFFTKISLRSKVVNWLSASCFAVYLIHCTPFIFYPYYIDFIRNFYKTESLFPFFVFTSALIALFFVLSIMFDKVRIGAWKFLKYYYYRIVSTYDKAY